MTPGEHSVSERMTHGFFLAASLCLLYATVRLILPLSGALLGAAILALMIHPLHARLLARLRRPTFAAALMTAAAVLVVVLPLTFGGWTLSREAVRLYPETRDWLTRIEMTAPQMSVKTLILENLDQIGAQTSGALGAVLKNMVLLLLNLVIVVVCLFFFLRDGPLILSGALELVPMPAQRKAALLSSVTEVVYAVVHGLFAAALVQGLLSWAGFALFGVPFPALFGTLCLLASPIPVLGPALVWVPVTVVMAATGSGSQALFMALWFGLIVSFSDNLVRPLMIGVRARLPIPLIFLGVVGGLRAFGWAGLFAGVATIVAAGVAHGVMRL